MATIEDVAALAEVSRMTVSRVINKKGYVGAETRKRVEDAIRQLNYKPNMLAKALVTKRTSIIAYVMVNISDPFHSKVEEGFESVAYHSRFTSMICALHSEERYRDYISMFQENCIGGVVFHHLDITAEQVEELERAGVKCLLMDNARDIPNVSCVNTDNYAGGRMAVEHLYEKGHRRIGCVHGVMEPYQWDGFIPYEDTFQYQIWKQRTAGFTDAMKDLGLEPAGYYLCNGRAELAENDVNSIVDDLLAREDKVTALYCENDMIAISILKRLQEKNIRVPEDMAIVGHDGLDLIKLIHPQLTTIAQPRYEMGCLAAKMLIEQIEQGAPPQRIVLQPQLQVGKTT